MTRKEVLQQLMWDLAGIGVKVKCLRLQVGGSTALADAEKSIVDAIGALGFFHAELGEVDGSQPAPGIYLQFR